MAGGTLKGNKKKRDGEHEWEGRGEIGGGKRGERVIVEWTAKSHLQTSQEDSSPDKHYFFFFFLFVSFNLYAKPSYILKNIFKYVSPNITSSAPAPSLTNTIPQTTIGGRFPNLRLRELKKI